MKTLSNVLAVIAIIMVLTGVWCAIGILLHVFGVVTVNFVSYTVIMVCSVLVFFIIGYLALKVGDKYYDPYKQERERNIRKLRK